MLPTDCQEDRMACSCHVCGMQSGEINHCHLRLRFRSCTADLVSLLISKQCHYWAGQSIRMYHTCPNTREETVGGQGLPVWSIELDSCACNLAGSWGSLGNAGSDERLGHASCHLDCWPWMKLYWRSKGMWGKARRTRVKSRLLRRPPANLIHG